jgi:hypothetical protein
MVTNSFGKRNFMEPMGTPQACTQCALFCFLLSLGGRGKDFFFFPFFPGSECVPTMFLLSSQWVPIMFSMCSPTYSPDHLTFYPICFDKCCPPFTHIAGPKRKNPILENLQFNTTLSQGTKTPKSW